MLTAARLLFSHEGDGCSKENSWKTELNRADYKVLAKSESN